VLPESYQSDFILITADDIYQGPVFPGIEKSESDDFEQQRINVDFLGWPLYFNIDAEIAKISSGIPSPENISQSWDQYSSVNYNHFLAQVSEVANILNLNNWAYYQLIKECSKQIFTNENDQITFQWVMLTRSRYKVRIGYQNNNLRLLMPSVYKFYNLDYITSDNNRYYILNGDGNEIITYDKDFPESDIIMNVRINKPFNTNPIKKFRDYRFTFNDKEYKVKLGYDETMMNFYRTIPLSDLVVYFNSVVSPLTKNSVIESFRPLLKGLDETQKLNLLLSFVQNAFPYKSDTYEYGSERYLFPDEVLHYPVSDCEDRSVLFNYLVKTLLGNETLIVTFPGHVATAISTIDQTDGISYEVDNKTYIIADPTFVGAPIGMTIIQARDKQASLIKLDSKLLDTATINHIKNKATELNIYNTSGISNIIADENGNYYVYGYQSSDNKNRKAIVAKFDKKANPIWQRDFAGDNNTQANYLIINNDNIYVAGSFENTISAKDQTIKTTGEPDIFIAKMDTEGNIKWLRKAGIDKIDHSINFIFAVKFNDQGEKILAKLYSEKEEFDHYGLEMDKNRNILFKGSFFASSGLQKFKELSLNDMESFNIPETLHKKDIELKQKEYEETIAGLFSAMNLLASYPIQIHGNEIIGTFDKYNNNFPKYASDIYNNLKKMNFVKNDRGIITIKTLDGNPVLINKIKISNDARVRIIRYKSGNILIEVLSGIYVGNKNLWLDLNSLKMFKDSGDFLLDYDTDNSVIKVNLRKEILNRS
jgi:hypothetical protein